MLVENECTPIVVRVNLSVVKVTVLVIIISGSFTVQN